MILKFDKFHGAGNDFILIDNREHIADMLNSAIIKYLCDRHFGIGADGLMLLNKHDKYDFEMDYYNSDGSGATICGNGGRCIVAFAKKLGIIQDKTTFLASDGVHEAEILENGMIKLKMKDVEMPEISDDYVFIDTGAPHHIEFESDIFLTDVYAKGKEIRYSDRYKVHGTNVDFVQVNDNEIKIRTYERGVENETLACGTGAVASAIAYYKKFNSKANQVKVKALGGELEVSFKEHQNKFTDVYLSGPARYVFSGELNLADIEDTLPL